MLDIVTTQSVRKMAYTFLPLVGFEPPTSGMEAHHAYHYTTREPHIYKYVRVILQRVTESDIDQAISSATEKLGYKELRPKQMILYWLFGIFCVRTMFLFCSRLAVARVLATAFFPRHSTFFARPLKLNHLSS